MVARLEVAAAAAGAAATDGAAAHAATFASVEVAGPESLEQPTNQTNRLLLPALI